MSEQAGVVKAVVPPALVDMSMIGLFEELMKRLDGRFGGDYRKRFLGIAKERHSLATNHRCVLSTAVGLHLLVEALDTKEPPGLRGARLVAEEVMRLVVTRNGNLFGKLDMEGMREFIGSELDLTDEALIEAWETIKSSREKEN